MIQNEIYINGKIKKPSESNNKQPAEPFISIQHLPTP